MKHFTDMLKMFMRSVLPTGKLHSAPQTSYLDLAVTGGEGKGDKKVRGRKDRG